MNLPQKILEPIPEEMSLAQFMAWDAPGPLRWQLVEGVPEAMAPAAVTHAVIQSNLSFLIGFQLRKTRPSCKVLANPGVRLSEDDQRNYRIPDLGVTCTPFKHGAVYIPNPILLIEILSPGNAKETGLNVQAYTHIASVEEILIFDSTKIEAENWRRFQDGTWQRKKFRTPIELVHFSSIEYLAALSEVYEGTGLEAAQ